MAGSPARRCVDEARNPVSWIRARSPSEGAKLQPMRLAAVPDLGMTMERVVAPIVVGREIFGYLWIVAGDHPLTELDELAIDHAATVAALVLFKEQTVREAQHAARGERTGRLVLRGVVFEDVLAFVLGVVDPGLGRAEGREVGRRSDPERRRLDTARPRAPRPTHDCS